MVFFDDGDVVVGEDPSEFDVDFMHYVEWHGGYDGLARPLRLEGGDGRHYAERFGLASEVPHEEELRTRIRECYRIHRPGMPHPDIADLREYLRAVAADEPDDPRASWSLWDHMKSWLRSN
ncbi:hypothetical protein SAMN04489717_0947 [Actinopolymorpha singaporensis]|uniref:Uncharacterized protein n=1 Tax=Actinopolymorpha singaporensis TaxID=117157 RepID=A0A1H1MSS8_9ACTN|nr:hypothetical protein SAMN04489717_0947 [Actinopolymorpha singaporensis]